MAELMLDPQYSAAKLAEVKTQLDALSEEQMLLVTRAFENRKKQKVQVVQMKQQELLQQATIDQQEAVAFRNHLDREYQQRILQGNMEQNLFRQQLINNQNAQYGRTFYGGGGFYAPAPFNYNYSPTTSYNSGYGWHQGTPAHYPSWSGNNSNYGYYGW